MQGVRAVEAASTAMPPEEREYPILASPVLWWAGDDAQTTKDAYAYTRAMRNALYTGLDKSNKKRHCYVNYASGEESKPEMYGYDARLTKLAKLKNEWDPENSVDIKDVTISEDEVVRIRLLLDKMQAWPMMVQGVSRIAHQCQIEAPNFSQE
ncbi:hypothetical protein IG631_10194 [Alternaria alternata]|nr:hypothetical protein IG631_10194 [Alternaria alternata]